jgi:hypothetical protein
MSASEVAPNPFWYAKSTAALTSRDRLSIGVLAMLRISQFSNLDIGGRQPCQASGLLLASPVLRPNGLSVAAEVASEWLVLQRNKIDHGMAEMGSKGDTKVQAEHGRFPQQATSPEAANKKAPAVSLAGAEWGYHVQFTRTYCTRSITALRRIISCAQPRNGTSNACSERDRHERAAVARLPQPIKVSGLYHLRDGRAIGAGFQDILGQRIRFSVAALRKTATPRQHSLLQ